MMLTAEPASPLLLALAGLGLEVTEVSEGGSVPNLFVKNRADRDVIIVDGEMLVGAKQNRTQPSCRCEASAGPRSRLFSASMTLTRQRPKIVERRQRAGVHLLGQSVAVNPITMNKTEPRASKNQPAVSPAAQAASLEELRAAIGDCRQRRC